MRTWLLQTILVLTQYMKDATESGEIFQSPKALEAWLGAGGDVTQEENET